MISTLEFDHRLVTSEYLKKASKAPAQSQVAFRRYKDYSPKTHSKRMSGEKDYQIKTTPRALSNVQQV